MAELKKCPFCGGEAFTYLTGSISNGIFTEVICKKCGSRTERLREDLAIELWNSRVNEFDADRYEKLVFADMERKHSAQQQLLSELKVLLQTTTEAEIRNNAIDEFAEKMKWEYENSIGISQREINFAKAVTEQVAEQLKGELGIAHRNNRC